MFSEGREKDILLNHNFYDIILAAKPPTPPPPPKNLSDITGSKYSFI